MTANHNRESQQHAFDPFRRQSDRRDRRDLTGGEPLPVAQPEDHPLFFLVFAGGDLDQYLVDFLELNALADSVKAVGPSHFGAELDRLRDGFGLGCASFRGQCAFEMIVDDIGSDHLEKSVNGVFTLRLERPQQPAIVLTELEVGILDQVVELRTRRFAEAARRPQHGRGDDQLEATDELRPRRPVSRARARSY